MRVKKRRKQPAGERWLVTLANAPAAVVFAKDKTEAKSKYPVGIADSEHSIKARLLKPGEKIKTDRNGIVVGSIPSIAVSEDEGDYGDD